MPQFDTHEVFLQLTSQGFSADQADSLTRVLVQATAAAPQHVATRADIEALRLQLVAFRQDVTGDLRVLTNHIRWLMGGMILSIALALFAVLR